MKLLSKHELATKKASERRVEIDEGVKLAKRVDGLRELAAQEEANTRTVREQSSRQLKAEIAPLIQEKEGLLADIKELKHERELERIPLDAEWEKVKQEKVSINGLKQALSDKEGSLAERTQQVEREEREIELEKGRTADFKHTAASNLAESESTLKNAKEAAATLRNKAQATLSLAEVREHDTIKREASVAVKEREVGMRESQLFTREKSIIDRERVLRDREALFARNLKRQHGLDTSSIPKGRK